MTGLAHASFRGTPVTPKSFRKCESILSTTMIARTIRRLIQRLLLIFFLECVMGLLPLRRRCLQVKAQGARGRTAVRH